MVVPSVRTTVSEGQPISMKVTDAGSGGMYAVCVGATELVEIEDGIDALDGTVVAVTVTSAGWLFPQ